MNEYLMRVAPFCQSETGRWWRAPRRARDTHFRFARGFLSAFFARYVLVFVSAGLLFGLAALSVRVDVLRAPYQNR